MSGRWWRTAVAATFAVVVGAWTVLNFEVTTDITAFLPDAHQTEARLSRSLTDSTLTRTTILTIGGPSRESVVEFGRTFEDAIRSDARLMDALVFIEGGPPANFEETVWNLYHPRRFGFAAGSADDAREQLTPVALDDAARRLLRELESPTSPFVSRVATADPLLLTLDLFDRWATHRGSALDVVNGRFVTSDGHAVVFLGTRASAFDTRAQRPIVEGIQRHFDATNAENGGEFVLESSGVNRFGLVAEEAIRGDIQRVSVVTTIALSVLLFSLFRSPRLAVLAAVPVGIGTLCGLAATILFFGRVHGVTVAFGASLLGVSLDYVAHLYAHHLTSPVANGPRATLRQIRPSLFTGAVTTAIGFAALGASGFAGLRELATFSMVGLGVALALTVLVLPDWISSEREVPTARKRWIGWIREWADGLARARWQPLVLVIVAMGLTTFGLMRAEWAEGSDGTAELDPDLLAEEERVRERVMRADASRLVVVVADTYDEALAANERLADELGAAVRADELAGFQSLALLLTSPQTQREVDGVFRDPAVVDEVIEHFERAGIRGAALAPFRDALSGPAPEPLDVEQLLASDLAGIVRPFMVSLDDSVGCLTFVREVADTAAVRARVETVPGAVYLDQRSLIEQIMDEYQRHAAWLLALGTLAIVLVLVARYRDARRAVMAVVPGVLAVGSTLGVLALIGRPIDLIVLTALLLVLSMGVDYGVFLVDASHEDRHRDAALLSISVAAMSTLVGFATLAFSSYPPLASVGITAAVGITSAVVLAPTALALLSDVRR